jgi:hypothetical protein
MHEILAANSSSIGPINIIVAVLFAAVFLAIVTGIIRVLWKRK